MAKAIKWQIPFASLSGTLYRIDIYAEGYSGDPIQLTAGESPFVTEEDSSEDFFAPIRTQTGSIQVCTRKPDGTMLTLDEILPANNIDHPVRLINLSNSNAIEWQGFLSCEAYSQNYTAIPENLTLSVISVLEAMDSVQISYATGRVTIEAALKMALEKMRTESGMSFYDYVNYSCTAYRIMYKYIDLPVLFSVKDYNNENTTTHILDGMSCKEVLTLISTYMGWVVREQSTTIYFERLGDEIGAINCAYSSFGNDHSINIGGLSSADIADFDWRGTDHKRDIRQGAKSVEVVASLKNYQLDLSLPEMPYSDLTANPQARWSTQGEIYAGHTNDSNDSNCEFKARSARWVVPDVLSDGTTFSLIGTSSSTSYYTNTIFWTDNEFQTYYYNLFLNHDKKGTINWYVMAFMASYRGSDSKLYEGLMIYGAPKSLRYGDSQFWPITRTELTSSNYTYKQKALQPFTATAGKLVLELHVAQYIFLHKGATISMNFYSPHITIAIQFGTSWARKVNDSYTWSSQFQTIDVVLNEDGSIYIQEGSEAKGIEIPIESYMTGDVYVYIYHEMLGWGLYSFNGSVVDDYDPIIGMLIDKLELTYEKPELELLTDRSDNHYFRLLGTNFRDEISIRTNLASSLKNEPSPSLIMESATGNTPITTIDYVFYENDIVLIAKRPEVDLLNRLASYYGASRQTLDLIVKHPTEAALPLLKLNGINDGKTYLPLSESRDWREETCTLRCFETI